MRTSPSAWRCTRGSAGRRNAGDPSTETTSSPADGDSSSRFRRAQLVTRSELGFTHGLEARDGKLDESTGRIDGTTRLNIISLDGKVTMLTDLGTKVFGEGLTIFNNEIFQLTWQDHQVFVYDLDGKLKRTMRNPREGWGLTNDGESLILSDGGPSFYFVDPATFALKREVKIKSDGPGEIAGLNELELVDGKLYGNLFQTQTIVRIDPASGCIEASANMDIRITFHFEKPDTVVLRNCEHHDVFAAGSV